MDKKQLKKDFNLAGDSRDAEVLRGLSTHESADVRWAVAANSDTSVEVLNILLEDEDDSVKQMARDRLGYSNQTSSSDSSNPSLTATSQATQLDLATVNLEKLQERASLFMGLTLGSLILGFLIAVIAIVNGLSSYEGLFGGASAGFLFLGIALLQLAFVFAVGYIFTSTMAQHASVNYHLSQRNKR